MNGARTPSLPAKPWYKSKSAWGIAIAGAGLVVSNSETIRAVAGEDIGEVIISIGLLLTAIGRITAKSSLTLTGRATMLLLLGAVSFALIACAGPQTSLPDARVSNTAANVARLPDGADSWHTIVHGAFPTNVVAATEGINVQTAGPNTVLSIVFEADGRPTLYTSNPADTRFSGLEVSLPNGAIVKLQEFESLKSPVIAAFNEQVLAALQTTGLITAEQAAVIRQAIQSGASLAEALAFIAGGGVP